MLHIHLACFVSSAHKERVMIHIHPACFILPLHHCLKNETLIHNYPACFVSLSLKDILHTLFKISSDMTLVSGDIHVTSGELTLGRHDRSPPRLFRWTFMTLHFPQHYYLSLFFCNFHDPESIQ